MSMDAVYHKLAVERCRHHVAQLAGIIHMESDHDAGEGLGTETLYLLIENLNRDFLLMQRVVDKLAD